MVMAANPHSVHSSATVIDMHCHPSLKGYLSTAGFAEASRATSPSWDPMHRRVTAEALRDGGVDIVMSAIMLPERQLLEHNSALRLFVWGLSFLDGIDELYELVMETPDQYAATGRVMDRFERSVEDAAQAGERIALARTKGEVVEALSAGETAVLHTIEGANSFETAEAGPSTSTRYGIACGASTTAGSAWSRWRTGIPTRSQTPPTRSPAR